MISFRDQAARIRSKWRRVVTGDERKRIRDHIKEKEKQPSYIKFFDKVAFTCGVLNILVCQYFLLNTPAFFWLWYSIVMPLLMTSRFYYFRSLGWQYFMIDFCYFTIFLTLMNIFFITESSRFFKVCYLYANGPLMSAILIWRNSLIFHDYDKIVSVYIHLLPSMLYYTLRWTSIPGFSISAVNSELSWIDYLYALLGYIAWQFLYILKTEVLDKSRLDTHPELLTSLRWMSSDSKNAFAKAVLKYMRKLQFFARDEEFNSQSIKTKATFVLCQFFFTVVTFLPTGIFYYSRAAHLSYIGLIFMTAVFNGASFYIEVFSKRYNSRLEKMEAMLKIANAASGIADDISALKKSISQKDLSQFSASPSLSSSSCISVSSLANNNSLEGISSDFRATSEEAWQQVKRHSDALQQQQKKQQQQGNFSGWGKLNRSSHLHVGNSDDSFSDSESGREEELSDILVNNE